MKLIKFINLSTENIVESTKADKSISKHNQLKQVKIVLQEFAIQRFCFAICTQLCTLLSNLKQWQLKPLQVIKKGLYI